MAQREVLEHALDLFDQVQGPAKIFYAPATLPMPQNISQVFSATTGAPATGWTALGATRGGINVTEREDVQVDSDIDQIVGEYAQRITNRGITISTQLAQVLDTVQANLVFNEGTPTVVGATGGITQTMVPLDAGANVYPRRRMAVAWPAGEAGRALVIVLRQVEPAGGDKTWRFDRTDKVSPQAEFRAFPELATDIPSEVAYGVRFQNL
jgi:hypothetical protein